MNNKLLITEYNDLLSDGKTIFSNSLDFHLYLNTKNIFEKIL